jgi:cell division protein FtsB
MIARGFRPVAWVGAVGGAALSCYMLSLNVAAERAELASIERRIIAAKQEIRSLQTELGTRGRMAQLEHWNAEVLALSAPTSAQFLGDQMMLARFDQRERTIDERAKVQMASVDTAETAPERKIAPADYEAAAAAAAEEPQALVRRAAYVVPDKSPLDAAAPVKLPSEIKKAAAVRVVQAKPATKAAGQKKSGLLDDTLLDAIGEASRAEKKAGGTGGQ